MIFHVHKTREIFLHECSSPWVRRRSLLQVNRKETNGPVDSEMSRMHEAEVHVLSDSVLCMGKQAMNMLEERFNKRWNEYPEQYKESAKMIDGEQIQFGFHMFLGERDSAQDRWMDPTKVKEKMDNILLQKPALIELFSWSLRTSCTLVQVRKGFGTLKKYPGHPKGKCSWQNKSRMCILYKSIQPWKSVTISEKETWSDVVITCTSTPVIHLWGW